MSSSTMAPTAALVESLLKPKPTLKMTQPVMPITAKNTTKRSHVFSRWPHLHLFYLRHVPLPKCSHRKRRCWCSRSNSRTAPHHWHRHHSTTSGNHKKQRDWLNGPSKLMMGLGIPPELNGSDALSNNCPIALRPKDTPKGYTNTATHWHFVRQGSVMAISLQR